MQKAVFTPLTGLQAGLLWGSGLLGILINSLVGLMDYQSVSWQRGLGVGCNRLLPINLPVASLFSASMASSVRPVGQQLSAGLVSFSLLSRWFSQVSSELYKKSNRERGKGCGLALWPRKHVGEENECKCPSFSFPKAVTTPFSLLVAHPSCPFLPFQSSIANPTTVKEF